MESTSSSSRALKIIEYHPEGSRQELSWKVNGTIIDPHFIANVIEAMPDEEGVGKITSFAKLAKMEMQDNMKVLYEMAQRFDMTDEERKVLLKTLGPLGGESERDSVAEGWNRIDRVMTSKRAVAFSQWLKVNCDGGVRYIIELAQLCVAVKGDAILLIRYLNSALMWRHKRKNTRSPYAYSSSDLKVAIEYVKGKELHIYTDLEVETLGFSKGALGQLVTH